MAVTKVLSCTCAHEFQNGQYGPGRRLHNACKLPGGAPGWRCTVCGREKGGVPVTGSAERGEGQ